MRKRNTEQPIIIKRGRRHKHAYHGGNWKVALADFMTSMFIFCLAMWLINIVTLEQKLGKAEYFAPEAVSATTSGAGGVLGGQSLISDGTFAEAGAPPTIFADIPGGIPQIEFSEELLESLPEFTAEELSEFLAAQEDGLFERLIESTGALQKSIIDPETVGFPLLDVGQTQEGLRITLRELDGAPMFGSGSANPLPRTRQVLQEIAGILASLPNEIKIVGHTDGVPFSGGPLGYTNWELSSDRANATRRVLVGSGMAPERMFEVRGKAATDPFNVADPRAPENRRIDIIVMRLGTTGPIDSAAAAALGLQPAALGGGAAGSRPVDALNGVESLNGGSATEQPTKITQ